MFLCTQCSWCSENQTDENSTFGGVLMCSEGRNVQLTEVWSEKQLQLFSCRDAQCFTQLQLACNRLHNVTANGVVFIAMSHVNQKIAITPTSSWHLLVYKRIQPNESGVRLWQNYSYTPQHSWAIAVYKQPPRSLHRQHCCAIWYMYACVQLWLS